MAEFKASVLNALVRTHSITSVIEFGCGDGLQLQYAEYPSYIGLDPSRTAIQVCSQRFADDPTKSFFVYDSLAFVDNHSLFTADLALSLEVVFHLTEDDVYEAYMRHLFASAERFVVVFSSNTEHIEAAPHVRHRRFTDWVDGNASSWRVCEHILNPYSGTGPGASFSDFYVFEPHES